MNFTILPRVFAVGLLSANFCAREFILLSVSQKSSGKEVGGGGVLDVVYQAGCTGRRWARGVVQGGNVRWGGKDHLQQVTQLHVPKGACGTPHTQADF